MVDVDHGHDHGWGDDWGTLVVEWTVDDTRDPRACDDYHAYDFELIVYDDHGRTEVSEVSPCDVFDTAIDLPPGYYGIDATLLDRRGRAVTTTLGLDDIRVWHGDDTVVPIDFPFDSQL